MYVDGKRGQQVHHHSFPPPRGPEKLQVAFGPLVGHSRVIERLFFFLYQLAKWDFHLWIQFACMLSHFSHVWLCDSVDCSPPGSSVRGILQARILEWVAVPSSRGSPWPRDGACVFSGSCWATREAGYGLGIEEQHYTLGHLRPILEFQACGCPARHPQSGLGYAVIAFPRPAPGWRRQVL